jgi:UDP-N-acetylmuramyl pentapeptide synthase
MTFELLAVATALGLTAAMPSVRVTGWSIDSRTLQAGDLFFALKGPNHDGHQYVEQVLNAGAAAAVVEPVPYRGSTVAASRRHARCAAANRQLGEVAISG